MSILIEDLPRMLLTKFRFIWPTSFRGEAFSETDQSETRIACGSHVWAIFTEDLPYMLPTKFRFIGLSGFRWEDFKKSTNRLWRPCLLTDQDEMSNLYREPSIDASYQVSVHLAKRFHRWFFRNEPIRNMNCLWRPCLLMDRDKMSNRYREPSIDASYQVSVHFAKRFQSWRFLRNWPITKKNCLMAAMFNNASGRNWQSL